MATKSELENTLSKVEDLLDEALDPELSREEVIGRVKEAYDLITGDEADDDESDDEGE